MSTHVLLNLLNEMGKRDKVRGLLRLIKKLYHTFHFQKILHTITDVGTCIVMNKAQAS